MRGWTGRATTTSATTTSTHEQFTPFFSPQGAAFMTRWWNRMPQFDGLFDYQNNVRPSYFAFKLLSRLTGDRLRVDSSLATVHGFATHDEQVPDRQSAALEFLGFPGVVELALEWPPQGHAGTSVDTRRAGAQR